MATNMLAEFQEAEEEAAGPVTHRAYAWCAFLPGALTHDV